MPTTYSSFVHVIRDADFTTWAPWSTIVPVRKYYANVLTHVLIQLKHATNVQIPPTLHFCMDGDPKKETAFSLRSLNTAGDAFTINFPQTKPFAATKKIEIKIDNPAQAKQYVCDIILSFTEFPVASSAVTSKTCTCDSSVLWNQGCQCGGI